MYNSQEHFRSLFDSCVREFGFHASSKEEFLTWQAQFRAKLKDVLGIVKLEQDFKDYEPQATMSASEDMGHIHARKLVHPGRAGQSNSHFISCVLSRVKALSHSY